MYKDYKDTLETFRNISDEIKSLYIIVDEFRDKTLKRNAIAGETARMHKCAGGLG